VLVLITVRGDQIRAIDGTIDGDFALPSAADSADFLAFRGAKSLGLTLFTNRAGHAKQNTPRPRKRQKRAALLLSLIR
jgi:hypothetical protein